MYTIVRSHGEKQGVEEASNQLQILENELGAKGSKFFGGDNINMVDIAGGSIAYWLGVVEEATRLKFFTKDKFPLLTEWLDNFVNCQVVKEILPPREDLVVSLKKQYGIA